MKNNIDIKFKDHFKLYVLLKDKTIFESELLNNGVVFYSDLKEQPIIDEGVRYFLLDSDRLKINKIITNNEIIASTETIAVSDYRDGKEVTKLYLYVFIVVAIIIILITIIDKVNN